MTNHDDEEDEESFDLDQSRAARDEGIARVADNNEPFVLSVLKFIRTLPPGWVGIGEDIRRECDLAPDHPNAWGAVINSAVRSGLITATGRYVSMKDRRSHARKTPEYRRVA